VTRRLSDADREMAVTILDIVASHPVVITTTDVADELDDDVAYDARVAAYNAWYATWNNLAADVSNARISFHEATHLLRLSYAEAAQRLREQGGAE
jgi:hypothetical protein